MNRKELKKFLAKITIVKIRSIKYLVDKNELQEFVGNEKYEAYPPPTYMYLDELFEMLIDEKFCEEIRLLMTISKKLPDITLGQLTEQLK